jgi:hypothetical protein
VDGNAYLSTGFAHSGLLVPEPDSSKSWQFASHVWLYSDARKGTMEVSELVAELQKFPPDTDVELYAGKCCDVQPIHQVYFHAENLETSAMVVLLEHTQQPCIPGRCNCS